MRDKFAKGGTMRKLKIIALLSLVVICSIAMVGCGGKSNELETRIKTDFLAYMHSQGETDMTLADVQILQNYGTFNGAVVVRMNRGAYEMITNIQVGGVDFTFDNSNTALVWKDGNFYELADAYDAGLLTKANLTAIALLVNK